MNHHCPKCHAPVAKAAKEEGGVLLAGRRFLIFPDRLAYRCAACGHEIMIPLALTPQPPQPLLLARNKPPRPAI